MMLVELLVIIVFLRGSLSNVTQDNSEGNYTELPTTLESATEPDFNVSTTFSNTTNVQTTTPNASLTVATTQKPNIVHHQDDISCLCDLHRRSCDIGCCCDQDCTYANKKVFRSCDAVTKTNVDRTACQYFETNYVNFTVHEWEIQSNDFFCVAKTNLPPSYTVQKEKPLKNYEESRLEKNDVGFWPHEYVEIYKEVNFSEPYVQGVPIKIVLNNSSFGVFRLSDSFFTDGCNIQSDISFLKNYESECVYYLDEENNFLSANFYSRLVFVAKPAEFNATHFKNNLLTCPAPLCIKPHLMICTDNHLRNCTPSTKKDIPLRCQQKGKEAICTNIVDSLKFAIFHNGIEGLKNITLFLHLKNVTRNPENQRYEITQKSTITFDWASSSASNYSDLLSGNPGYLVGRPILLGTLTNGTIRRDPQSYRDNFMVLPYEDMGVCHIGQFLYQPIEFGYNTILLCKIRGAVYAKNNSKPADVCRDIQTDIFEYWNIEQRNGIFVNRTYGLFGNAMTSIFEDWREIIFEKSAKEIYENVTGKFSNKNKTLTCNGLIFGLNIDIFHARVDLKKLVDQEKILGITHQFHLLNSSSTFNISNRTITYEFHLDTRVAFWDKTSQKSKKLLDPPSLNIKLPSDFFYPFVKMGNCGVFINPNFILVIILALFSQFK